MKIKIIIFFITLCMYGISYTAHASVFGAASTGVTSGLVGWWTFDGKDITNGRVNDVSGGGSHGNVSGISTSTFYTLGKIGQAFNYDGSNDAVTIPTSITDGSSAFSVSYWVKNNSSFDTVGTYNISKYRSGFTSWYFSRQANTGSPNVGRIGFSVGTSGGSNSADSDTRYPTDTGWHHIVGVYDGANLYLYGDTVSLDSTANPLTGTVNVYAHPICIGGAFSGISCQNAFAGNIDDVRVYNRALSAIEIKALYNMGGSKTAVSQPISQTTGCVSGSSCGLVGWWTFDGKDVTNGRVNDVSGGGNHGNTSGISTSTFYTTGKIGQAFNYDGSDDYINVGSASSLDNVSPATYTAWVKMRGYGENSAGTIFDKGNTVFMTTDSVINGFQFTRTCIGSNLRVSSPAYSYNDLLNKWIMLTATWDGTLLASGTKLYLNGVEVTSYSAAIDCGTGYSGDASSDLRIGNNSATTGSFNGVIDDTRVYNRVLSAGEIKQLYTNATSKYGSSQPIAASNCITGLTCKLVAWWTFDGKDVSYRTIRDISGGGNNGTTVSVATSTFFTRGKIGQGVSYDGTNDSISMSGPTVATDFSVSMWIRPRSVSIAYQNLIAEGFASGIYLANNKIDFFDEPSSIDNLSTTPLVVDKWYHVVVACASTICTHYLNSVANGSFNFTSSVTFLNMGNDGLSETFRGEMDDVRVYNRALGLSDIKALYNAGK